METFISYLHGGSPNQLQPVRLTRDTAALWWWSIGILSCRTADRKMCGWWSVSVGDGPHICWLTAAAAKLLVSGLDYWLVWAPVRECCSKYDTNTAANTVPILQQIRYQYCSKYGTSTAANTVPILQQIRYQYCSKYGTNTAANTVPILQQIRYQYCSKYGTNIAANTVPILQQ